MASSNFDEIGVGIRFDWYGGSDNMTLLPRVLVAAIAALAMGGSYAQVGMVGGCPLAGAPPLDGYVGYGPGSPMSSSSIAIVVSAANTAPEGVTAVVQGNAINVTLSGLFFGLSPPAACGMVVVGPLPRGSYTINYYLALSGAPPTLQATRALLVADPIPATSPLGLAMLALFVGLLGSAYVLRRAM